MPYVTRDTNGNITGVFNCAQHEGQEFVENATLLEPPRTSEQGLSDGYAYLAAQGWTKNKLDAVRVYKEAGLLSAAQLVAYNDNFAIILQLIGTVAQPPHTFDSALFPIPHTPSEFGL